MSDKDKAKSLELILAIMLIVPIVVFRGYVLKFIWMWFVVPLGVTQIGTVHAIGLSFLITMFTGRVSKESDEKMGALETCVFSVFQTALYFLLGYVVHLCM